MKENKMIAFDNIINKGDTLIVKGTKLTYEGNNNMFI